MAKHNFPVNPTHSFGAYIIVVGAHVKRILDRSVKCQHHLHLHRHHRRLQAVAARNTRTPLFARLSSVGVRLNCRSTELQSSRLPMLPNHGMQVDCSHGSDRDQLLSSRQWIVTAISIVDRTLKSWRPDVKHF